VSVPVAATTTTTNTNPLSSVPATKKLKKKKG